MFSSGRHVQSILDAGPEFLVNIRFNAKCQFSIWSRLETPSDSCLQILNIRKCLWVCAVSAQLSTLYVRLPCLLWCSWCLWIAIATAVFMLHHTPGGFFFQYLLLCFQWKQTLKEESTWRVMCVTLIYCITGNRAMCIIIQSCVMYDNI